MEVKIKTFSTYLHRLTFCTNISPHLSVLYDKITTADRKHDATLFPYFIIEKSQRNVTKSFIKTVIKTAIKIKDFIRKILPKKILKIYPKKYPENIPKIFKKTTRKSA